MSYHSTIYFGSHEPSSDNSFTTLKKIVLVLFVCTFILYHNHVKDSGAMFLLMAVCF